MWTPQPEAPTALEEPAEPQGGLGLRTLTGVVELDEDEALYLGDHQLVAAALPLDAYVGQTITVAGILEGQKPRRGPRRRLGGE